MALRSRDPGLQPERTALSWHRTSFSSLILALVTVRSGFSNGDVILAVLGTFSTLFAMALVLVSLRRQWVMPRDMELTSSQAIAQKRLFCMSLGINAMTVTLHSLSSLF
ncbi:DUF202 domain-containing protein [Enterobacteriaceae bacterium BIT-l23]|uniref:DUF202 domain-containing protein n=1 Tax=Jejubacter sp. L23 TaxID=3092086 RepID=UPI001584952E|nr:DUF202 domain-containing protein [Enterobacteriaceae bacterium BIT-l23]